MKLHHTALVTHDIEAATRFYRDGLGMEITLDITPEAEFTALFNAHTDRLHSVFLSDPADATAGILELVEFDQINTPPEEPPERPQVGFFLISFYVDLDEVAARMAALGFPLLTQIEIPAPKGRTARMATLRDPDGVLVELIDVS
jgi:catechol 2,3-dioxygenase-like lactoylglutathione lyase family enzyme